MDCGSSAHTARTCRTKAVQEGWTGEETTLLRQRPPRRRESGQRLQSVHCSLFTHDQVSPRDRCLSARDNFDSKQHVFQLQIAFSKGPQRGNSQRKHVVSITAEYRLVFISRRRVGTYLPLKTLHIYLLTFKKSFLHNIFWLEPVLCVTTAS